MAIVTLSYEMGAPGPEVGMTLAHRLNFRYVDHELISEAARQASMTAWSAVEHWLPISSISRPVGLARWKK